MILSRHRMSDGNIISRFSFQVFGLFNDVAYAIGTYFLYVEWRANPIGAANSVVPPAV